MRARAALTRDRRGVSILYLHSLIMHGMDIVAQVYDQICTFNYSCIFASPKRLSFGCLLKGTGRMGDITV